MLLPPGKIPPAKAIEELWRLGILSWKLWPQQLPIYDQMRSLSPEVDEAVLLCARQFGKSHLGTLCAIEDCIRYPDRCILIMGPTIKQTRDIVSPRLRRIAADAPKGLIRPSKSEGKWYIGDSELVLGGFEQHSGSQRGKTVQNVYIEEIVDADPDKYEDSLRSDIGPALTHSDCGKIIFLTTLPKLPDHPFIVDTMSRAEMNGALYRYTIYDNKALTERQFAACVRRAGGMGTNEWKREYLCIVVRDGSLVVVPSFDKALDVRDFTIPTYINWEVFIDFGGVRDLTVAGLVGYDFFNAQDLLLSEKWWPTNTGTDEIVRDLREWQAYNPKRWYADAPGQILVDLQTKHGISATLPQKDDWEAAINQLNVRFGQRKFAVHPSCKLTATTLQSGVFNKNRTDFARSRTLGHNDAIAMSMYACRTLDRSNPYPQESAVSTAWQQPIKRGDDTKDMSVMVGKSFSSGRRFGS